MYIYEKIMKIRCEEVVSFEKSQGIGKLDKRQRYSKTEKEERGDEETEENGVINELDMEGGIKF
ncbi:hypothetical protein RirG_134750 [Rhizophagus irregularis DAOM 197198w]|uniref:Uncharacterized protein n=1 Tax=Rhizophagus irregularis (strain DAOM 197198w) TaxID=1432141 RepID=A0A015JE41_RHIIW|nr:hypothetical protein RirG_134750 [Rhizophagus irregularis DAOM 197198w]